MAFGITHHFVGGTAANYEATIAAVHPASGDLPEGQLFHAAGPSGDGWTIFAVHESQASWENFRDNVLNPRLAAGVEGGFPEPPIEATIELHTLKP